MDEPFITLLSRPQAIPGGGAAAAFAASVATALLEKIVRLEIRRERDAPEKRAFWQDQLTGVLRSSAALAGLRDEDGRAYLALADAKAGAGGSVQDVERALAKATDCPLSIMRETCVGLNHASNAGESCAKHLLSDLLVVCELLKGAGTGAFHIASANLRLMRSPESIKRYNEALRTAEDRIRQSFTGAEKVISYRLGSSSKPV